MITSRSETRHISARHSFQFGVCINRRKATTASKSRAGKSRWCASPFRNLTFTSSSAARRRARELAETKYSYDAYLERTRQACAALMTSTPASPPGAAVKDVA